ncbi:hypothetical protein ACFXOD_38345, partial [Streptomyces sp. NPDC059161]|uniref:hypothetical protein n=1 Tax=Streptomyces sp. NPDC059161 TaxID=3346749 RepID=UPI0036CF7AFD
AVTEVMAAVRAGDLRDPGIRNHGLERFKASFGASPCLVDTLILDLDGSGGSEKTADGVEGLFGRVQS